MPILKDAVGNELHEGSLVYASRLGMVLEIISINHGGLSIGDTKKETPGEVVFQFRTTLPPKQAVIDLKEFYAVVDPKMQAQVSALVEAGKKERVV